MATITNKAIIAEMLRNEGRYDGDPAPDSIWQYKSVYGRETCFACFYCGQYCDIYESPFVKDPVLLFEYGEITPEGRLFLKKEEEYARTKNRAM